MKGTVPGFQFNISCRRAFLSATRSTAASGVLCSPFNKIKFLPLPLILLLALVAVAVPKGEEYLR